MIAASATIFQSTSPARGTTSRHQTYQQSTSHFNPRPPRGGRPKLRAWQERQNEFQSTSPARGTTGQYGTIWATESVFQSTSPARGTTPGTVLCGFLRIISIHVPREGDDHSTYKRGRKQAEFQSTSPARGTTILYPPILSYCYHFNPRPPRGGRHLLVQKIWNENRISIHVPREGDDLYIDILDIV